MERQKLQNVRNFQAQHVPHLELDKHKKKTTKKPVGGAYCGNKATPHGKVRGTSGYCFVAGRRAGFVGGISKGVITKAELELIGDDIKQRPLQAIAKSIGVPNSSQKKSLLLPRVLAFDWDQVSAKDVLLNL